MFAILIARRGAVVQKWALSGETVIRTGTEVNSVIMKYIKFVALLSLAAAALTSLNACSAQAKTTSSGSSAHMTTTSSK